MADDFYADIYDDEEMRRCVSDTSSWMTNLPENVTLLPIRTIAIPGSHDTGAYMLDVEKPVAPDESNIIQFFGKSLFAKRLIRRWSLTQSMTLKEQLEAGVRYLDMRPGYCQEDDDFYFVHGLYGPRIADMLIDLAQFLDEHPKEVVILDFNHFYLTKPYKPLTKRFEGLIVEHLSDKLLSPEGAGCNSSLTDIWKQGKQVITFFSDDAGPFENPLFWDHTQYYSPWFNTSSSSVLVNELENRFNDLKENSFNVFQAILSPQTSTIVLHWASSLRKYLVSPGSRVIAAWLRKVYTEKKKHVNICICDFIQEDNCLTSIIQLNSLLKS